VLFFIQLDETAFTLLPDLAGFDSMKRPIQIGPGDATRSCWRVDFEAARGSVMIAARLCGIDPARDQWPGGEAGQNEGSGDGEEGENFDGHGVHLFVCLAD
jgi:hypothetical protein